VRHVVFGVLSVVTQGCVIAQGRPEVRGGANLSVDAASVSAGSSLELSTGSALLAAQASARRARGRRRTGVSAELALSLGGPLLGGSAFGESALGESALGDPRRDAD